MGKLIDEQVATLFEGVSRQPDTVRLPGQVQESINAVHSVVTGGFEKRGGSHYIAKLTEIADGDSIKTHFYDRDTTEQYVIMAKSIDIDVRHLDGTSKTVTILDGVRILCENVVATGNGTTLHIYPATGETTIDLVYTGWGVGTVIVETSPSGSWGGEETTRATITGNGSATVTLEAFIRCRTTAWSSGTFKVTGAFKDMGYLKTTDVDSLNFVTVADTTIISNSQIITLMVGLGSATVKGPVKQHTDLPREGETVPAYLDGWAAGSTWADGDTATGDVWKVEGEDGDPKGHYYMVLDRTGTSWTWDEAPNPNFANDLDPALMPHKLVRKSDGNFEFGPATWTGRVAGDPTVIPDPDFVGFGIRAVTFYKDRLTLIADENTYSSQPGDYFNMFPDSATQVKDSDPFGRVASGSEVNLLNHAIPFRNALWVTSSHRQFELSSTGGALTARTADISPATKLDACPVCAPVALGDELYFSANDNNGVIVYEYFIDDDTISNTATDVTKHIGQYMPSNLLEMATYPPKGLLFALSSAERNNLFVYSVFWSNNEKAQSAWHKWSFGATETKAFIHGMSAINGSLYVVIKRDTVTYLERIHLENELLITTEDYPTRMDRKEFLTGVYDGGNDWTTWTMSYPHDDNLVAVLTPDFSNSGSQLTLTYPTSTTVRSTGDHSAHTVAIGQPYTMAITLSKIFVRDPTTKRAFTRGRLQLHQLSWDYEDTGFFEIVVTPAERSAKTYKFNGRIIGGSGNVIGGQPLDVGTYTHRVGSKAATVLIVLQTDKVVPCTITSLVWLGTFNEVSKQEGRL